MRDAPQDDLDPEGTQHESVGSADQGTSVDPKDAAILQEILEHYELVQSIEHDQRAQEDEDLEFDGVDMWLPEHRTARAESIDEGTQVKIAAKPTLSVHLIEHRVQEIMAEARQARLGISVTPKAGLANTKQAGYYKGLVRSIQAESGAGEVRLWALDRTAKCGRGAYRVDVDFANDEDFDLDILIKRILDQSTVWWDPLSVMADRRDADWVLIAEWVSEAERRRRWPDKPLLSPVGGLGDLAKPWFDTAGDTKRHAVLIGTYYKVIHTEQVLVHHPTVGTVGPKAVKDLEPALQEAIATKHPSVRVRKVFKRSVRQYIVDGTQVLEDDPWLGTLLPVLQTIGREYLVKGKRSWKGIVTNAKDLNRGYNVAISSAVEAAQTVARAQWVMYAGQDAGFEEMWDDSPIKAYNRLYVNPMVIGDKPAPFPQRQNQEPAIQGALLLARALKDDLGTVTGGVDPATRAVRPYDRSGKAIEALQRQGSAGTSNFLDNLATITMVQEGRVIVDLIPKVYDRPGRLISVMGEEHDDETVVMLMVPFVRDADGAPVPVPCPICKGQGTVRALMGLGVTRTCPACQGQKWATRETMPLEWQGKKVEYVNLAEGQFKVSVSIGRNYQTKQEEAMAAMTELAHSAPPLVPVYADLWVRAMGFSGSTEIADRIKRMNPHATDPNSPEADLPPAFAAKYQQLQQEHAQAMEALQKATQALQTDQVKMEGQQHLLAMKLEAAENLEHLRQQSALMKEDASAKRDTAVEQMKAGLEAMRQESEQRHEVLLEMVRGQHQQDLARAANETKLAVAEEGAKTERMGLFLEERARLGVGEEAERARQHDASEADLDRQATREQQDADRRLKIPNDTTE